METIEYRGVVDKTDWERGPWDREPDKIQWQDEATGMACLVVRGPHGALCGYVGIPAGHPWHGVDYDNARMCEVSEGEYVEESYVDVHGGLTFAGGCSHGAPDRTICHVPAPGEPDDVWWLGFDCAHAGDYTDMKRDQAWRERRPRHDDEYRDVGYVRGECGKLARQAAQVAA